MLQKRRAPGACSIHNEDTEDGEASERGKLFHITQYAFAGAGKENGKEVGDVGRGCENSKGLLSGQGFISRGHKSCDRIQIQGIYSAENRREGGRT